MTPSELYNREYERNTKSLYLDIVEGHTVALGINRTPKEAEELLKIIHAVACEWINVEYGYYPTIDVKIAPRKVNANGCYVRTVNKKTRKVCGEHITMSGRFMRHVHVKHLLNTLKHELIHYHLHKVGLEFRDGTPTFEAMMRKYNLPSNYTNHNKAHPWSFVTNKYVHVMEIDDDFELNY